LATRFRRKDADTPKKRTFWQKAWNIQPTAVEGTADGTREIDEENISEVEEECVEVDPVFTASSASTEVPGVPRITIKQAVEHTTCNSYEVWIGRSISRPINPAVKINFFKRHLKLIGASQHGKSSMAAALLDAITRTHDPELVQIALLDLEDKTGRLFADLPHIARVRKHGEAIRLHARNYEQVLEHLGYISSLIDLRYGMSDAELKRQTLLIVYLEEFIDLKDYFKQRVNAVESNERDQAKQDYAQLVYFIKKIAARGLKVYVQLLMCAQVDYRDDDLQAALVNVTSGMSFCVRPSAAQAAGFYQTELLSRNAKEDKIGQAVVEMPDCKDLILAPEYDLGEKLRQLHGHSRQTNHGVTLHVPAGRSQDSGRVSENIHHSLVQGLTPLNEQIGYSMRVNAVNAVNAPVKPENAGVNVGEYSHQPENVSPSFTAAEETQVLLAYAELLKAGRPVTRTGIRDELDWDNKQYTRIVKPVCDKHNIGG
jgi:FtsK/SpoIIIE family